VNSSVDWLPENGSIRRLIADDCCKIGFF
jgi:hypothetical protein